MVFRKNQALTLLVLFFFVHTLVYSIRRCGQDICRDEQICCPQGNNSSAVTCCKQLVDKTYYNIAMVTRKLSGVLILLLLFALGYSLQRVLCSKTGRLVQAPSGHPPVTTSQDPLMESNSPDQALATQLPSYDESKRLPTYEETMRDKPGAAGANCAARTSVWQKLALFFGHPSAWLCVMDISICSDCFECNDRSYILTFKLLC